VFGGVMFRRDLMQAESLSADGRSDTYQQTKPFCFTLHEVASNPMAPTQAVILNHTCRMPSRLSAARLPR
jgi:hypothetical protein